MGVCFTRSAIPEFYSVVRLEIAWRKTLPYRLIRPSATFSRREKGCVFFLLPLGEGARQGG